MRKFGLGMIAGFVAIPAAILAAWLALAMFAPANLPAPAISSLVHMDEKLRFVRRHPEIDPTILAVGSSITWRQLDGAAFVDRAGGPTRFFNGGTGFLRPHQTHAMIRFYLRRFQNVRTVLVMVGPPDFRDCTEVPRRMFEPDAAARYAFDRWPAPYFYLRYFSPGRYLTTAASLAGRRAPLGGDLYLDRYGSGPVLLPPDQLPGLRYGDMTYDPACVDALVRLARDVAQHGRHLLLVFAPVNPEYREKYPQQMRRLDRVAARMERERKRYPASLTILHMARDSNYTTGDFYDAFHLQWPAVRALSARIAHALDAGPNVIYVKGGAEAVAPAGD